MGNPYPVAVTANTVMDAINEMFKTPKRPVTSGLFGIGDLQCTTWIVISGMIQFVFGQNKKGIEEGTYHEEIIDLSEKL